VSTTAATMTEAELLSVVLETAALFGWRTAHFRPAVTSHGWRTAVSGDGKGFPDLVLIRERLIAAELKSAAGRLSVDQSEWLLALEKAGVEVHVWRPEAWTDGTIERVLRATP
jgi:hypothetical protein